MELGLTETLPEVAPPVEKLVPVQLVAFDELHVRTEELPLETVVGDAESAAAGPTAYVSA